MEEGTTFVFKGDTSQAEQSVEDFAGKLAGMGKGIGLAFGALFAADKLVQFFNESTKAAMESEAAIKEFNFTLKAAGVFTEELSSVFQDYAQTLQNVTGVQDEVILKGAKTLIEIGNLSGDVLNKTLVAGLDLAAARGIDAAQAFEMLARAANGITRPFNQMGVEFSKNATDAEKFNKVLGFINDKWAGAAQEKMKGYEGAVKNLSNAWGDLFETFGKMIIKSEGVIAIINGLASAVNGLQTFGTWVKVIFLDLLYVVFGFGTMLKDIFAAIVTRDFGNLKNALIGSRDAMNEMILKNHEAITTSQAFGDTLNNVVVPAIKKQNEELYKSNEEIDMWIEKHNKALQAMKDKAVQLGQTVSQALAGVVSRSIQQVVKNIVEGKNAFGGFVSLVANLMGDLAIQLGTMFIATGIAIESLKSLGGFAAIAAGIGLIAVGTILKSLSGGSGGDTNFAAGSAANPVFTQAIGSEQTPEEERAKAQTGIQVVVQGNIFDNRETGLQIAQIISDSFDVNGTQIRGYA